MLQDSVSSMEVSPPSPLLLASRTDRFLATIVDIVIALAVAIPVGILTGEFSAALNGRSIPGPVYLENALVGWAWFFIVNAYLLKKYGQTVGKYLVDVRISDNRTGSVPPFWRLLVRLAIPSVAGLLGALGGLFSIFDILFIFRKDRRCIHDLIAGTRVVAKT